jgi:hypothetical protein
MRCCTVLYCAVQHREAPHPPQHSAKRRHAHVLVRICQRSLDETMPMPIPNPNPNPNPMPCVSSVWFWPGHEQRRLVTRQKARKKGGEGAPRLQFPGPASPSTVECRLTGTQPAQRPSSNDDTVLSCRIPVQ